MRSLTMNGRLRIENLVEGDLVISREVDVITKGYISRLFSKEDITTLLLKAVDENPQDKVTELYIKKNIMGWTVISQQKGIDKKDYDLAETVTAGLIKDSMITGFERIL